MQHVYMKGVALNPFATVNESTECTELPVDSDTKCIFHRMYGTHLVGDWAYPTDARRNIRGFAVIASA